MTAALPTTWICDVPDIIDRACDYEERHRLAGLRVHEERRQREQAQQQALAGGPARRDCTDCGDRIPPRRLRAQPLATRCTPCQARQERH